jgi:mitochondrial splicing suppressor protein 51
MVAAAFLKACANCDKTSNELGKPLKPCAKCKTSAYCDRKCQKDHFKKHKKECGKTGPTRASSQSMGPSFSSRSPSTGETLIDTSPPLTTANPRAKSGILTFQHPRPFQALQTRTWLLTRPRTDVYKLLIDTFRVRLEDNFKVNDEIEVGSIYHNENKDSREAFSGFLAMAGQEKLLPEWLLADWILREAVVFGLHDVMVSKEWGGLKTKVTDQDIVEWYKEESMPLQMRVFAQQVYGDDPSGQAGDKKMRAQMMTKAARG